MASSLLGDAGGLDGERVLAHVDHLGAEDVGDLYDLVAALGGGLDLEEHQLALDGVLVGEVGDLVDADQLVELLGDLLEAHLVGLHDDGHAREALVLGGGHREGLDVEAAARDHAGHAGEHAGFVLHQDGEDVAHHSSPPFSSGSGAADAATGFPKPFSLTRTPPRVTSSAPMMSSMGAPGATIG